MEFREDKVSAKANPSIHINTLPVYLTPWTPHSAISEMDTSVRQLISRVLAN
jgi:hypothetical protein